MGDGKEYTIKEQVVRELSKHGKLALILSIKTATLITYTFFMKSAFAQDNPLVVKIVTGAVIGLVATWIVTYIKNVIRKSKISNQGAEGNHGTK